MSAAKFCVAIYKLFQAGGTSKKFQPGGTRANAKPPPPAPVSFPVRPKLFSLLITCQTFWLVVCKVGFLELALDRQIVEAYLHLLECRMREVKGLQQRLVDRD